MISSTSSPFLTYSGPLRTLVHANEFAYLNKAYVVSILKITLMKNNFARLGANVICMTFEKGCLRETLGQKSTSNNLKDPKVLQGPQMRQATSGSLYH